MTTSRLIGKIDHDTRPDRHIQLLYSLLQLHTLQSVEHVPADLRERSA